MICVTSVVSLKTEVKSDAWQGIMLCPIPSALPLFMQSTLPGPRYATVVLLLASVGANYRRGQ